MAYVDGFVTPVKKARMDEYCKFAKECEAVWREYGALDYQEFVADDVPMGELTSFPRAVQQEPDETVIFAWIKYESRKHRDEVNAKVMKDPRMKMEGKDMPFSGKRMIFGGFEPLAKH